MTELEQIEDRVLKLSPEDFEKFRKWFREQEWVEGAGRSRVTLPRANSRP